MECLILIVFNNEIKKNKLLVFVTSATTCFAWLPRLNLSLPFILPNLSIILKMHSVLSQYKMLHIQCSKKSIIIASAIESTLTTDSPGKASDSWLQKYVIIGPLHIFGIVTGSPSVMIPASGRAFWLMYLTIFCGESVNNNINWWDFIEDHTQPTTNLLFSMYINSSSTVIAAVLGGVRHKRLLLRSITLKLTFSASRLFYLPFSGNTLNSTIFLLKPVEALCLKYLVVRMDLRRVLVLHSFSLTKILCIFHIDVQAILMIEPQHLMKKNRFGMFLKQ